MNTSSRNRYRSSKNENGWWKLTGQTTTIKNDDDEVIGSRRKLFFNFYLPKEGGDDNTRWIVHEFEVQGKCKLPQDQKNQTEEVSFLLFSLLYTLFILAYFPCYTIISIYLFLFLCFNLSFSFVGCRKWTMSCANYSR